MKNLAYRLASDLLGRLVKVTLDDYERDTPTEPSITLIGIPRAENAPGAAKKSASPKWLRYL